MAALAHVDSSLGGRPDFFVLFGAGLHRYQGRGGV